MPISKACSRIFYGNRAKRVYVSKRKNGIPFLSSSDILQANLEDVKLASKKYTSALEQMVLQKGWTLISRSGTVGNCAFATANHAEKLASEDVIRLVPNNFLKQGMLFAYLASKYGHSLLTQGTFGAVIQHIEPDFIGSLPIPDFPEDFQKKIDDMIQESARLREDASDALNEAIKIIENHFPSHESSRCGLINIKGVFTSLGNRFEANYHYSKGKFFDDYIKKNFEWKPLSKMADVSRPGLFKRCYVNNGLMFLGGADIFLATPMSKKFVSRTKTSDIPALTINEGMILMPRSGTIGAVAFATSQHAQKLASEDVIRINSDNILRTAYLYAFLSSNIGKSLIQRYIFGSVIQHVEPHLLNEIPIPILPSDQMQKIGNLAIKNKDCLGKSGELELKAIKIVEQEIEKWNS